MEYLSIKKVKSNPNNPRTITDENFEKLLKSIKEFPKMLELRPLVVDENLVVLGGNMRLKACIEAGIKKVPILYAKDLSEEEKKRFIIADNVGFGDWNWDALNTEWKKEDLNDWGLAVWVGEDVNLDEFFEESNEENNDNSKNSTSIILEYTADEYELVINALKNHKGTKEAIFYNLLGL